MKKNNKSLSDLLPFWHFDSDVMVFSDGSLGTGYKLRGIDIGFMVDTEINNVIQAAEDMLVLCEEGIKLQVFYRLTPKVSELIADHKTISATANELYNPIRNARLGFLENNEAEGNYYEQEIYFFIRSQTHGYRKRKFWEKEQSFKKVSVAEFAAQKEIFLRSAKKIESSLEHIGLKPQRLSEQEWFNLLFEFLNLSRSENLGLPNYRGSGKLFEESLASQLALTDVEVQKDKIIIGDYLFRVITLKTLPDSVTYASMINEFTKLPFHFWLSQNVHLLNQSQEREKLGLQRRITHSMAAGSQKMSDIESESKLAQIEELMTELTDGSEKLVTCDLSLIIWAKTNQELEEKSDEVLKSFQQLNQSEGIVETFPALEVFMSAMPGSCQGFRHRKMKSSNAAHLLPIFSSWKGNQRPVCLVPNRENSLFAIDPFAPELPNWNGLIFGGSGGGKSFAISQLMLQFCGQAPKPRIIWIDNGASSQKLIEVLDGEFIDLNLDSGIRLNLFDLENEQHGKPTPSKIKLILGVLEVILKDTSQISLPKRDKALLEEAIFRVYDSVEGRTPTLSDLKVLLQTHEAQELRRYAEILYSWTGNTAYGQMLDGQTNVKLTKDLVTIEIRGLDSHKELKDIFLLLFTSYIREAAAKDLATPYLLIIDEAARLFGTASGRDFAIESYRVFRKYNAGIWCISQNYRDFLSDQEIREAFMPNTTNVFILRQKKIDWRDFQQAFDFNDAQIAAIKSLEIVKHEYSELFFMQDENQAILRLVPEPLSYWICTTDGNDLAKIAETQRQNPQMKKIDVLQRLAT